MSCRPTRPTCTLPSQVITALHPGLRSLLSPRGLIFALFSCVFQSCAGTTVWLSPAPPGLASPCCCSPPAPSSSPAPTSSLCCIPTLYGCSLSSSSSSSPSSLFPPHFLILTVSHSGICCRKVQTFPSNSADHIHSLRDCMKMIRGLETGYASF